MDVKLIYAKKKTSEIIMSNINTNETNTVHSPSTMIL